MINSSDIKISDFHGVEDAPTLEASNLGYG